MVLFQLMHDIGRPAAGIDRDRMLVWRWLLQGRELAVEQRHWHEVLVPS
jgi:hypothetical protein